MKRKKHNRGLYMFSEVTKAWLADTRVRVKQSSYEKYVYLLDKHILSYFGGHEMRQLTVKALDDYIIYKLTDGKLKRNEGISKKYLQDILCIIKAIAVFCEQTYGVQCKIYKLRRLKAEKPRIKTLNKAEKKKLSKELTKAETPENLGIMLGLYTGLRIGEVCGLKWEDFDEISGTITINRTVQRISDNKGGTVFIVSTPKTESSQRVVPLPDFLAKALSAAKRSPKEPVVSKNKSYMEPSRLRRVFKALLAKCSIAQMRFHDLRHTFASDCVRMNCDTKMLSELLGHASVSMTLDRYVHTDIDEKKEFMQKLRA